MHVGASVGEGEYVASPLHVLTSRFHTLNHLTLHLVIQYLIYMLTYAVQTCPMPGEQGSAAWCTLWQLVYR